MIITNGECFNEIFQRKTGLNSFAFNEAFMIGEVNEDLFSDEFIALRIYSLHQTCPFLTVRKVHLPVSLNFHLFLLA